MINGDPELTSYYADLQQEVRALADIEEGSSTEEKFTEYIIDLLAEAGETENAVVCTDIREDRIGRRLHKINGYAIGENSETLDLFVSVYNPSDQVFNLTKKLFESTITQAQRFLQTAGRGYFKEIEESSEVFDLAYRIHKDREEIIRINIFIISNYIVPHDFPFEKTIRSLGRDKKKKVLAHIHLWDLERLYRLWTSSNQREAVEIYFDQFGSGIYCLKTPEINDDYQCYLAIIPGDILSSIYRVYGARLLEKNVRTFLQFTGKVNKGIRDTIRNEPHMFLPYNNGIACTAEEVELEKTPEGYKLKRAKDFQIVNGGQTTASIFHTDRKFNVDLSNIFVQMKLTVIRKEADFNSIVSRISLFANSQNKVTNADLTSSNPFHIRLEELSRTIWAPDLSGMGRETQWFFERARGQYRDLQARERTRNRKKAFEKKYPPSQRFQKEDVAKYVHAWEGKPFWVARGRQKNYAELMKGITKEKVESIDSSYYEDLIACAILFKSAEKIYGRGVSAIGDIRFVAVPYAISWLSHLTEKKIDLFKIWKRQSLSLELSEVLRKLLERINNHLKYEAEVDLISEWAKKEECWLSLRNLDPNIQLSLLRDDLITTQNSDRSNKKVNQLKEVAKLKRIEEVPHHIWSSIEKWGDSSGTLDLYLQNIASNIAGKIRSSMKLTSLEIQHGQTILDKVTRIYPEILEEVSDNTSVQNGMEITVELLTQFLDWEKRHEKLLEWKYDYIKQRLDRRWNESEKNKISQIIHEAILKGFEVS